MFLLIWWQVALLVSLAQILLQLRVQFTIAQLDPQILVLVIHDNIYTCHLSISFRTVVHFSISITSFLLFVQTAQITFDNNVVHAAVFEFYLQLILTENVWMLWRIGYVHSLMASVSYISVWHLNKLIYIWSCSIFVCFVQTLNLGSHSLTQPKSFYVWLVSGKIIVILSIRQL